MVLTFATTIILHSPVQTDNISSSVHVITQEKAIVIIIIRCVTNNQHFISDMCLCLCKGCDYYDNAIIRIIAYKQYFLLTITIIMWIVA